MHGPTTIELHYSKFLGGAAFLWAVSISVQLFSMFFGLAALTGTSIFGMLFSPVILFIVYKLIQFSYRAFTRKMPIVVLDEEGLTDTRQKLQHVAWTDVEHISLGWSDNWHYLRLQFRSAEAASHYGRGGLLRLLFSRATGFRDYDVFLLTLSCSRTKVLEAAKRLHGRALTKSIRELNQGVARDAFVVDRRE